MCKIHKWTKGIENADTVNTIGNFPHYSPCHCFCVSCVLLIIYSRKVALKIGCPFMVPVVLKGLAYATKLLTRSGGPWLVLYQAYMHTLIDREKAISYVQFYVVGVMYNDS